MQGEVQSWVSTRLYYLCFDVDISVAYPTNLCTWGVHCGYMTGSDIATHKYYNGTNGSPYSFIAFHLSLAKGTTGGTNKQIIQINKSPFNIAQNNT